MKEFPYFIAESKTFKIYLTKASRLIHFVNSEQTHSGSKHRYKSIIGYDSKHIITKRNQNEQNLNRARPLE